MSFLHTLPAVFRQRPLFALITALHIGPAVAAEPPAGSETALPAITVTGNADSEVSTEKTGLYTTSRSSSATKMNLSLRETPQTVSVLSRSQLDDFKLDNVNDALAASSGIVVERPETDRTYYTARGFDVTNFQFDGIGVPFVYDIVNGDIDTAIYDRIEAVYGANGLMSATGFPSATVNFIRKRPTVDFAASASLTAGSWDKYRFDTDVSGALIDSGRIRGRLVFAHEDKNSYLDRYSREKTVFYGIVETDLAESTQLAIGHHTQINKPKSPMWGALPLYYSDGSPTNFDRSTNTAADWAVWDSKTQSTFVELTHHFNDDWLAKAVVTRQEFTNNSSLFYVYGTPDRTTGLGLFSYPSQYDMTNKQTMVDLYATGHFSLAGRKHDVSIGASWAKSALSDLSSYGQGIGTALPPLESWTGNYPMPTFDAAFNGSDFTDTRKSAFFATRFNLRDDLKLIAGVRATSVDVRGTSYGGSRQSDTSKLTPYFGAIYDLLPALSVYGSYTELFNPQYQVDATLAPLDPVRGNSKEIGLKSDFFNKRLNASLAYFQTEQNGLAEAAGYVGPVAIYRAIDAESSGVQLDISGALTERLQVNLGYTQLTLTDPQGNDVRTHTPRRLLRLSGTYRVPMIEQLKVGANVSWQDDIHRVDVYDFGTGATTRTTQPAYALVNLMARYDINKHLSVSANLNNLTDEKYFTSLMWSQSYYGAPRNFSVSLNWKY